MAIATLSWAILMITFTQLCWITSTYCPPTEFSLAGNVTIVVLGRLHESHGHMCGKFKPEDFKFVAALRWAADKVNSYGQDLNGFMPGLNIGLKIYDDCGSKVRSVKFAADVMFDVVSGDSMTCDTKLSAPLAGVLALGSEEQVEAVAGVLKGSGTPILAPLATSLRLDDNSFYPNLLRTSPSNSQEAEVMFKVARELQWSYVALVYTSDYSDNEWVDYMQKLATRFGMCLVIEKAMLRNTKEEATGILKALMRKVEKTKENRLGVIYFGRNKEARLLFDAQDHLGLEYLDAYKLIWMLPSGVERRVYDRGKTAIFITLQSAGMELQQLRRYFEQLHTTSVQADRNNTFERWKQEFVQTSPEISNNYNALTGQFKGIFDAFYLFVASINKQHQTTCSGKRGVCNGLREALHKNLTSVVSSMSLKYDSLPREVIPNDISFKERVVSFDNNGNVVLSRKAPLYTLHYTRGSQSREIGSTTIDKVSIANDVMMTNQFSSSCKGIDRSCIEEEEILFSYIPGDVLILGVFPLRKAGDKFKCGGYSTDMDYYTAYEAFNHAIIKAQMWYKTKVGAVVIDDCKNTFQSDYVMSQIFSGKRQLVDKASGDVIDVTKVVLVVGGYSSDVSVRMADLLTRLRIPQISYASSSLELDDRIRFPYFLRVVPSDSTMLSAMANTMKTLGITYVSFVYTDNSYGRTGMQYFTSIASQYGICVADPIVISEREIQVTEMDNVVRKLSQYWASAVVFIGNKPRAKNLLDALKKGAYEGQFFFFTCGQWIKPSWLLADRRGDFAKGSISIVPNVTNYSVLVNSFPEYLSQVSPTNCRQCTWTKQFWQHYFKCNIERGFENKYDHTCGMGLQISREMADDLSGSFLQVGVIHAVLAGVRSVHITLEKFCENQPVYPCSNYFKYIQETVEYIKNTSLDCQHGKKCQPFQSSGNGNLYFEIYNLQSHREGFFYEKVGEYKEGTLTMDSTAVKVYDDIGHPKKIVSVCQLGQMCEKCKAIKTQVAITNSSSSVNRGYEDTINKKVFIAIVTSLSALVLVGVSIVLFQCCRKYTIVRKRSPVDSTTTSDGAAPVHPANDHHCKHTNLTEIVRQTNNADGKTATSTSVSSRNERALNHRRTESGSEQRSDSRIVGYNKCLCHRHQRTTGHDRHRKDPTHIHRSDEEEVLSSQSIHTALKCALYIKDQGERKNKQRSPQKTLCPPQRDFHYNTGFTQIAADASCCSTSRGTGSHSRRHKKTINTSLCPFCCDKQASACNCGHFEELRRQDNIPSIIIADASEENAPVYGCDVNQCGKANAPTKLNVVKVTAEINSTRKHEHTHCCEHDQHQPSVRTEVNVSRTEPVMV